MEPINEANSKDEFIRPGEPGFTSFPKHLPEDCVSYDIYVLHKSLSPASALRSRLLEIQKAAFSLSKSLLKEYIWQRESFNLTILPNDLSKHAETAARAPEESSQGESLRRKREEEILHLHGSTNFGDSIADEWLIVFLLRELSKSFEDVWIRIWDADGEFLLAEAANKLPKWINPEIADFRVWINHGRLLIIPRSIPPKPVGNSQSTKSKASSSSIQIPRHLTLSAALSVLQKHGSEALLHDPVIETEAFRRISNYPADIALSMHTSIIPIPRNLAYLLHRNPLYISPAIEAFYLRDPIAMKPLRDGTSKEDLVFGPEDCVSVSVKFTRVGFAQLRGQDFTPPSAWREFVSNSADPLETRNKKEISMKLCCGFEMLLHDPKNEDDRHVQGMKLLLDDLESGEDTLPSDTDIAKWEKKDDDESWLDIDFSEFEKKLAGTSQSGVVGNEVGEDSMWGFKDKATEEKTRMLMERLMSLMQEGEDGGSSEDEMDFDDDDDDDDDDDEEYDEEPDDSETLDARDMFEQSRYQEIRRRMGLPAESEPDIIGNRIEELDSNEEIADPAAMKKVMDEMEAELRQAGIFDQQ